MTHHTCRLLVLAIGMWTAAHAQTPQRTLGLFLLEHRIGDERYSIDARGDTSVLTSHFEYLDRGAKIALDTALTYAAKDFTPVSFESHGKSYRYFSVDTSVPTATRTANTFTLDGMAPLSAQAVLVRCWLAHGKPPLMRLAPSGDTIRIREIPEATDIHYLHDHPARRFVID